MISEAMLTATFSALADPTRREILTRLRQGERSVGELAEPLEMSWPAVTKHLKVLEAAGLLERRREGRRHVVSLNAAPLEQAGKWMEFYRGFWENSLDRLADYLESEAEE
ncbi:MAG: ArsR/SmtB family transcription factor [Verrucomicrobiales bacterium]